MRCEDEFHVQLIECLLDLRGVQSGRLELLYGRANRFADRIRMLILFSLTQDTNSLAIFRKVGEVKKYAQRSRDKTYLVFI